MKAILRTYDTRAATYQDELVEIDDAHNFTDGPYADTVPFAVGSNQTILPLETNPGVVKERLEEIRKSLQEERISFRELVELDSLRDYIEEDDMELREAAGIPEFA